MEKPINKKLNTFLFIVGAVIFNSALLIGLIFGFNYILNLFFPNLPQELQGLVGPVMLIAAVFLMIIIWGRVTKLIEKKVDMDKYFDPIVKSKQSKYF